MVSSFPFFTGFLFPSFIPHQFFFTELFSAYFPHPFRDSKPRGSTDRSRRSGDARDPVTERNGAHVLEVVNNLLFQRKFAGFLFAGTLPSNTFD